MTGAQLKLHLPSGDYLNLAVFGVKKDPAAEVLAVSIQRHTGTNWEDLGRLSVFRSGEGNYSEIHNTKPPRETQEQTTAGK
jgi:hypothetical protein